jgi:hypothetical protein
MKRLFTVAGLGMAGLALAISLSLGAFALAGRSLSEPPTAVRIAESPAKPHARHEQASPSHRPEHQGSTPTQSPTGDHGGSSGGSEGGAPSPTSHGSNDNHSGGDD